MIVGLQRSVRTVGRIRIGQQVATRNGKTAPAKLDTFRLSSPQRAPIERAAQLYGGQVAPMTSDRSDDQWEVITTVASLPVVIPPTSHLSQSYEQWDTAGCQRRCDGREATVMDGRPTRGVACACDPERRDCTITTRLSVVLPELEALGVWRLDTKGWYAATELAGAADLCAAATSRGLAIPARLDLEARTRRGRDANGKPLVHRFAVPVLSVDVSLPQAQAILGRVDTATGEIPMRSGEVTVTEPRELGEPPSNPRSTQGGNAGHAPLQAAGSNPAGPRTEDVVHPGPSLPPSAPPAELPPPPPADIPAPRTHADYERAQEPPQEPAAAPTPGGGMTDAQRYAASLPGKLTDEQRHALYHVATRDPTARYATLSGRHRNQVTRWARQIEAGELTLEIHPSGPALVDTDENIVASAPTEAEATR